MPELKRVSGAVITVNPNDHPPPHVHVYYQDQKVRLRIADASTMDPVDKFHARILRDVQDWLRANRDQAANAWAEYHE